MNAFLVGLLVVGFSVQAETSFENCQATLTELPNSAYNQAWTEKSLTANNPADYPTQANTISKDDKISKFVPKLMFSMEKTDNKTTGGSKLTYSSNKDNHLITLNLDQSKRLVSVSGNKDSQIFQYKMEYVNDKCYVGQVIDESIKPKVRITYIECLNFYAATPGQERTDPFETRCEKYFGSTLKDPAIIENEKNKDAPKGKNIKDTSGSSAAP